MGTFSLRRLMAVVLLLVCVPVVAFGQATVNVTATDAGTGARAQIGETDDGSIAGSRIGLINIAFSQVWDGSVWRRFTIGTAGSPSTQVLSVQGVGSGTALPVSGTFWQATQPVSLASVPSHAVTNAGTFATQAAQSGTWNITNVSGTVSLPTGAATEAKQPALGVAGTASTDVLTVQGVESMTPLDVQGLVVVESISNTSNVAVTNGSATDLNSHAITVGAATMDADAVGEECAAVTTASTNASSCTTTASNFYGYEVFNPTTTAAYLRLYNLAASPTCSSATGFYRSIPIPPASAAGLVGGAIRISFFPTHRFSTGIAWCITGGASSTDNTSAGADIRVAVFKKET